MAQSEPSFFQMCSFLVNWRKRIAACLLLLLIPGKVIGAEYTGKFGNDAARARLDFGNERVSGFLCVEASGLSLQTTLYEINGQNPTGKIQGSLRSGDQIVGSISADRETRGRNISWKGTVSLGQRTQRIVLSRDQQQGTESGNHFGRGGDAGIEPGYLTARVSIDNFDRAISLLQSTNTITKIDIAPGEDRISFLYGTYLDKCTRRVAESILLALTVDEFKLRATYDQLVASRLFTSVRTEDRGAGPESEEIPIPRAAIPRQRDPETAISNFLDGIVERYFRQLRNTPDACRRHDGQNILVSLRPLPEGSRDPIVISQLETNKFYVRRFDISGLIPNPNDQNPWAHWRSPMDMMRQGWSTSLFHAAQQWSTRSS
jgi:hypothetical protein